MDDRNRVFDECGADAVRFRKLEDQLSACRADNAELQRELDEARRTCSLVQDDFTRVERERDDLRAVVPELRVRIAELNGQLDEKVKRIAELEIDLDDTRNLLAQSEMDLVTATTRANYWQTKATAPPAADRRKTRDEMLAELSDWLDLHDKLTAGVLLAWLLRWEPKS